jgi:prepilin-type N-terminal cleavage/methylation domain-containing protein
MKGKTKMFEKRKTNQKGYTLIELLITIAILAIVIGILFWFVIIGVAVKGNMYFTEEGVLRELKVEHPGIEKVVKTERNIMDFSKLMVLEKGENKTYCLDSDILFNYKFSECK